MPKNCTTEATWRQENAAAIRALKLELSPGIQWIPPPTYRPVFTCRKCRCTYASYISQLPKKPHKRYALCGNCGHHQIIFESPGSSGTIRDRFRRWWWHAATSARVPRIAPIALMLSSTIQGFSVPRFSYTTEPREQDALSLRLRPNGHDPIPSQGTV